MKKIWVGAVVLVLVAGGIFYWRTKKPASQNEEHRQQQQAPTPAPTKPEQGNTWTGTLQISDVKAKGNLMIVLTDGRKVYLTTSRDWSALLGKNVVATYEGTPSDFTLLNIESK